MISNRTFATIAATALAVVLAAEITCCAIGVSPSRYEFRAAPGEKCGGSFFVVNEHEQAIPVIVEVKEGARSRENEGIVPVTTWLSIETAPFTVPAKEQREIPFEVTVPTSAAGMFSGRIAFVDSGQQGFATVVSVPVYVTIKGTEIVDWTSTVLTITDTPVGMAGAVRVANRGNVLLRVNGKFTLRDRKGREVFKAAIGGGNVVYPGQDAAVPVVFNDLRLEPGKYTAAVTLSGYAGDEKRVSFNIQKNKKGEYAIEQGRVKQ